MREYFSVDFTVAAFAVDFVVGSDFTVDVVFVFRNEMLLEAMWIMFWFRLNSCLLSIKFAKAKKNKNSVSHLLINKVPLPQF